MKLCIAHLYPEVLNLYGDRGNIRCMKKRLEWRGLECTVDELGIGAVRRSAAGVKTGTPGLTGAAGRSLSQYDLFFIGGGQDFEQEILLEDLRHGMADEIRAAVADGKTFLCICGGYQMMGHYYETARGVRCGFIGAVDLYTVGGEKRQIGNYSFRLGEESGGSIVAGFENHSGRTYLGSGVKPLGTVLHGSGNNGKDGTEGVRDRNVFGTYSHGPVLPANPAFCDKVLETALYRKYGKCELEPLDDRFELAAHEKAVKRRRPKHCRTK